MEEDDQGRREAVKVRLHAFTSRRPDYFNSVLIGVGICEEIAVSPKRLMTNITTSQLCCLINIDFLSTGILFKPQCWSIKVCVVFCRQT